MSTPELVALVDASSHLKNLRRHLSLVQRPSAPLPPVSAVQPHLDDRFGAAATKVRKSAMLGVAPDRIRSEGAPPLPFHQFVIGTNSRAMGRDPRVALA